MSGTLEPARVVPLLRGRFGYPYVWEPECASTQLALHDPALLEGAVAATEHQTAGRGRLGRTWDEPAGSSVLMSVLLRPLQGRAIAELSLVAGLAVARAIERETGAAAFLKWPNDVLLGGAKVAGVLAEARDGVIVGIGVNVAQKAAELPARDTLPAAGSLLTVTGVAHDRAALLAAILRELERAYDAWLAGGLEPLLDDLAARDAVRGRRVRVDGIESVGAGIDAGGRLVLTDGRRVASGELELLDQL